MTGRDSAEGALQELRRAADTRDWNACSAALGKLLVRLSPEAAWEVAREQLERRLPAFERHQPGVTWPRDFLATRWVANPPSANLKRWPWPDDEFPGPGANSFINGVDELWQALHLPVGEPRRLELLNGAIQAAIMAETSEAWGARNPERWAYGYKCASTGEGDLQGYEVLYEKARDPETRRMEREAWHEVADRLAEALGVTS